MTPTTKHIKKGILGLGFILTLTAQVAIGQWVQQNSTTTESLQSASFVDSLNGWVAGGHGTILHTTNGGETWTSQNSNSTATLYSISFCDLSNGWTVGSQGTILRTTNGGNLWIRVIQDTTSRINHFKVQCLNPSNIVVLRDSQAADYQTAYRIWKTTNAGSTWSEASPGPQIYYNWLLDMFFLTPQLGWSCGIGSQPVTFLQGCQIHQTSYGGGYWQSYWFNPPGFNKVSRVFFEDANHGWATDRDTIYRSSDGGVSWSTYSFSSYGYNGITDFIMKDSIGYITAGSSIKKSTDKGLTWSTKQTGTSLYDLALITQNNVWVVGYGGLILHTTNGGVTFTDDKGPNSVSLFRLEQNYPNPFNPSTKIHYALSGSGFVRLSVLDILGREVDLLINETKFSGEHDIEWNGSRFPSGVYFVRLTYNNFVGIKKMMLLR